MKREVPSAKPAAQASRPHRRSGRSSVPLTPGGVQGVPSAVAGATHANPGGREPPAAFEFPEPAVLFHKEVEKLLGEQGKERAPLPGLLTRNEETPDAIRWPPPNARVVLPYT